MINTTETENICGLKRSDFQTTVGGKETDLYILKTIKAMRLLLLIMVVHSLQLWFQIRMAIELM